MAGNSKGVTVVAKLLGGRGIETEAKGIEKSYSGIGDAAKKADAQAVESSRASSGQFELFRAKEKKAVKEHQSFLQKASRGTSSLLGGGKGLMAAGGLGVAGYASIKHGMEVSSIEAITKNSLRNIGQLHSNTMGAINKTVENSALHGGFEATEQLAGINRFITLTHSATKATQLNIGVTNLARGAHLDFGTAQKMMQQVLTGSTGKLQKYLGIIVPVKTHMEELTKHTQLVNAAEKERAKILGIQAPAAKQATAAEKQRATILDKQATAQKALGIISQKFGGATNAYTKTAAGGMSNLKNSIGLLEDKVGKALLPTFEKVVKVLSVAVGWLSENTTAMGVLAIAVGGVVVALMAMKVWTALISLDPIVLGVIAFAAAAYLLISHWKQVKSFFVGVFDWIKGHWKLLAAIILAPFALPLAAILLFWNPIVGFFKGLPGKLASVGRGMFDWLKNSFRDAIDFILGIWNSFAKSLAFNIHLPEVAGIGGGTLHFGGLPQVPMLGEGGTVRRGGSVIVGDRGPELLNLAPGARVDPLLPGGRGVAQAPGTWRGHSGDLIVSVQIDRREIGRAVVSDQVVSEVRRR